MFVPLMPTEFAENLPIAGGGGLDRRKTAIEDLLANGTRNPDVIPDGTIFTNIDFQTRKTITDSDLRKVIFDNVDLSSVSVTDTLFDGSSFRNVDAVDFRAEDLSFLRTDFSNAIFSKTIFSRNNPPQISFANLPDSQFNESIFGGVQAEKVFAERAKFIDANFAESTVLDTAGNIETNLDGTPKLEFNPANFRLATLNGADFRRADLREVNFEGANLFGADFRNADLTGADFSGANLGNAKFGGAILVGTDFSNSIDSNPTTDLYRVPSSDPRYIPEGQRTNLNGATFSRDTTFTGTIVIDGVESTLDFSGATFEKVSFRDRQGGYDLTGVNFSNTSIVEGDFRGTNLTRTNFNNGFLSKVSFRGATYLRSTDPLISNEPTFVDTTFVDTNPNLITEVI